MKKTKLPSWNLSDLYKSLDDPKIVKDKKWIELQTKRLTKLYKSKINNSKVTADLLLKSIEQVQKLNEKLAVLGYFANLLHSKNSADEKINKFYQQILEFDSQITSDLLWFQLEWQKLPEAIAKKVLTAKQLTQYQHFLQHSRLFSQYKLSEVEEIIMAKKDQTAATAFVKFYDEMNGAQRFEINKKKLNYSQIARLASYDRDRKTRELAAKSITKSLDDSKYHYTFALNNLLLDKKINDEIRNFSFPQQQTFLRYEVDAKIVDSLVKAVIKNYIICERYYKAKAKILKTKGLHEWDRYAAIYPDAKQNINWDQAKKLVLDNFYNFSPEFSSIAQKFFDRNWIDAEVVNGKTSGAFCSYLIPTLHPYILMNFTGETRDVSTLAHELGHGIHAYLSRRNKFFNFWPSTATAEIASIFCESVVFDAVLAQTKDHKSQVNLLAANIEEAFSTIFRQIAFYLFETDLHTHRREKGQLTTEEISNYFQIRLQAMFGKSLKLTQGHRLWWMNVGHFYHYNFYVFTYAFGEALTKSLYALYKKEGDKFVNNYTKALALGGSASPLEITKIMGVDISDSSFWDEGIKILETQVDEFEKLADVA